MYESWSRYLCAAPKKTFVCKELRALDATSLYASKEFNGVSPQEVSDMIVALRQDNVCNDKDCRPEIPHCHLHKDSSCCTLLSVLEYSNRARSYVGNHLAGLLTTRTMARQVKELHAKGVQYVSMVVSMFHPHAHVKTLMVRIVWNHIATKLECS